MQSFNKNFEANSRFETPLILSNKQVQLHIFFDHSIVEVFANNGEAVLTAQIFPAASADGIELFSSGGKSTVTKASIWKIKSIW